MKHHKLLINIPLILFVLLYVVSCGRPVTDDCSSKDFNILCSMLYNEEKPTVEAPLDNRNLQLEGQVEANRVRIEALSLKIDLNSSGITGLNSQLSAIILALGSLEQDILDLNSNHASFLIQFTELQNIVNTLSITISTLSSGNIIEVIDLCDNHKEVLIKLGNGTLIAVYVGNDPHETRLQVLTPGDYESTDGEDGEDGEDCKFTVHSDNSVSW